MQLLRDFVPKFPPLYLASPNIKNKSKPVPLSWFLQFRVTNF